MKREGTITKDRLNTSPDGFTEDLKLPDGIWSICNIYNADVMYAIFMIEL